MSKKTFTKIKIKQGVTKFYISRKILAPLICIVLFLGVIWGYVTKSNDLYKEHEFPFHGFKLLNQNPSNNIEVSINSINGQGIRNILLMELLKKINRIDHDISNSNVLDININSKIFELEKLILNNYRLISSSNDSEGVLREIEKVSDELRVKCSLATDYIETHDLALKEFREELTNHGEQFSSIVLAGKESLTMSMMQWAEDAEGIIDRLKDNYEKRTNAYSILNNQATKLYHDGLAEYRNDVQHSIDNLSRRLIIRGWEPENEIGFSMRFHKIRGVENILSFLNSKFQTVLAYGEEAATFIPVAGDVYDLARLKWNPREIKVLEPNINDACKEITLKLSYRAKENSALIYNEFQQFYNDYVLSRTAGDIYETYKNTI